MEKMNYSSIRTSVSDMMRYGRNNDSRILKPTEAFFREGAKSPTIADLIRKDQVYKSTREMTQDTIENEGFRALGQKVIATLYNIKEAVKNPQVQEAKDMYDNAVNTMYPKTKNIRDKLVESGKVVMEHVTPKAGWLKKIRLAKYMK